MIFAGDAVYTYETLDRMIIGGFHLDPVDSISALKRIKQWREGARRGDLLSHDMEPWLTWKHAPEFYD